MRNIMTALAMIITLSTYAQKVRVINTGYKYQTKIVRYSENNDCVVRATAEALDISYKEAADWTYSWGRLKGQGGSIKDFRDAISRDFKKLFVERGRAQLLTAKEFVRDIAEDGYTYIVFSQSHTFVIEKKGNRWLVKGNAEDDTKKIFAYVKLIKR